MSTAIIGTNVKIEVQKTKGTALTISGLTKANPGVATSTAHGLSNGDVVVFDVSAGMVELDGQAVRVSAVDTDTFTLEGLDTSAYSDWSAGTASEITAWSTMGKAQNFTMPNPNPNRIDITTLVDKVKQYAYGLPEAPEGQITGLFNPTGEAEGLMRTATKANATVVYRVTFASGLKAIFNAHVSGGSGFELAANAAATATVSFTPRGDVQYYAN